MIGAETSAFHDPVRGGQAVFRSVMAALAKPASPLPLACDVAAPAGLSPAAAAVLLTLADFETSFWLDEQASCVPAIGDYLRFYTGAKLSASPSSAQFALITEPSGLLALTAFAQGEPDYPDRSTTLVVEVPAFAERGWSCTGPGIQGVRSFGVSGLPDKFLSSWAANTAAFPLGVDILFVSGGRIAGLPRTTRLTEG